MWEIRGEPLHLHPLPRDDLGRVRPRGPGHGDYGLTGPLEEWRELRDEIRADVLEHGYDEQRGTFVQHYGTTEVDASLLVLPLVGFLDGDDPRMLGTIKAIEEDLLHEGLVLPLPHRDRRGRPRRVASTRSWPARSGWSRRTPPRGGVDDAHALFDRLVGLRNDVGLLSEEYDPVGQRMVGNFPQAFSHLALVQAAFSLAEADRAAERLRAGSGSRRPGPQPSRASSS